MLAQRRRVPCRPLAWDTRKQEDADGDDELFIRLFNHIRSVVYMLLLSSIISNSVVAQEDADREQTCGTTYGRYDWTTSRMVVRREPFQRYS